MSAASLVELYERRRAALNEAHGVKKRYELLVKALEPLIARNSAQADALAAEWGPLVQQSREAYANGDGALAKALSLEYRPLRAQCVELNEQANEWRQELKASSPSR